jgi:flagellar biosynthesis protein
MTEPRHSARKRRLAACLEYLSSSQAPRLTAKGEGETAEKIIALAKHYGIPIKEDPDLITILARLDIGQEIPEEIYVLVAEVLAFVYALNNDWPGL